MQKLIFFLFIILLCCIPARRQNNGVNIYLLEEGKIAVSDLKEILLSELPLCENPIIPSEDIDYYDFSTHMIYLKRKIELTDWHRKFVVTANGKRCYRGFLWSVGSSETLEGAKGAAVIEGPFLSPIDIVMLSSYSEPESDPRNDQRVKQALINNKQFRAGLQCHLDKVLVHNYNKSSSVEYTFTVKNNDVDALYVLDPDKLERPSFHYFTNGVRLESIDTDRDFADRFFRATPEEKIDTDAPTQTNLSWFIRLKSGETMTRTVSRQGSSRLLPGRYKCKFRFPSPFTVRLEKAVRIQKDGRIWLGRIDTPAFFADVKE